MHKLVHAKQNPHGLQISVLDNAEKSVEDMGILLFHH